MGPRRALPQDPAHPARAPWGIRAQELADLVGVSKRTIYRDIDALSGDTEVAIWQDEGKFGLEQGMFLPPLALTLQEATTLFLAARILAKTTDEHDPELIGALTKLSQVLPTVLAEHISQTMDAFALTPRNERFTRVFRVLAEAWAGRRVVEIDYDPGVYDATRGPRRRASSAVGTRAIGADARAVPDRVG